MPFQGKGKLLPRRQFEAHTAAKPRPQRQCETHTRATDASISFELLERSMGCVRHQGHSVHGTSMLNFKMSWAANTLVDEASRCTTHSILP